ncbi:TIGR03885 family FMN-dependent LLM class oxidoreductase [Arthrobacter sp. CAN_C5]|uniref:TIGR03885 family FMN-dependent LLM class oxidoreductase n=1 Tax=Arthrobacter sp. CAN_C5 TaxID=2760706 RepID=UPI001AE271DA|nr:TIGR03885 family FMN-dependent LLM class oxidoreductase [Arthrobacter sp. CAN_C5]MBP2217235.1 putative non-F420 flavinoid oxidoreductase [Arthrobacter sp. CAN_C5]
MPLIGFHASHEQIAPGQLLADVQLAEQAGFDAAMCSDHFEPWSKVQGHSGFAWSWLGAALATTRLRFGVVTAPGQRYHPAIIAQASGTLASMFPGRFWAALGSGENLNEHITGDAWPPKEERQQRIEECVDIIRRMHDGEEVTHRGLVTVEQARLWDVPEIKPQLIAPAISVETAARSARWADGLVTTNQPHEKLTEMINAYRDNGGQGKLILQVHLSWAPSEEEAVDIAHRQWSSNCVKPPTTWDLARPSDFEEATRDLTEKELRGTVQISADLATHAQRLREFADLGFDELYLHYVGTEQKPFIETFAEHVLPEVR